MEEAKRPPIPGGGMFLGMAVVGLFGLLLAYVTGYPWYVGLIIGGGAGLVIGDQLELRLFKGEPMPIVGAAICYGMAFVSFIIGLHAYTVGYVIPILLLVFPLICGIIGTIFLLYVHLKW